ncbi:hypothetical protein [Vibrio sp. SCSIO 43137]|uniref:hypothetical protein n=1 Tax=Vibrio sp. SCSIO 43137 TaxID=3021011 RepID=UPI0023074505|nr:hypothetical protein [Vibrio sp. SCSIO 43137]WCE28409.1 hypothetical protein PK654_08450 [Vibrio sp. SCSIO 43137]
MRQATASELYELRDRLRVTQGVRTRQTVVVISKGRGKAQLRHKDGSVMTVSKRDAFTLAYGRRA